MKSKLPLAFSTAGWHLGEAQRVSAQFNTELN